MFAAKNLSLRISIYRLDGCIFCAAVSVGLALGWRAQGLLRRWRGTYKNSTLATLCYATHSVTYLATLHCYCKITKGLSVCSVADGLAVLLFTFDRIASNTGSMPLRFFVLIRKLHTGSNFFQPPV